LFPLFRDEVTNISEVKYRLRAYSYTTGELFSEDEINRTNQKQKPNEVIPTQCLVFREDQSKDGEYYERNDFLNHF